MLLLSHVVGITVGNPTALNQPRESSYIMHLVPEEAKRFIKPPWGVKFGFKDWDISSKEEK